MHIYLSIYLSIYGSIALVDLDHAFSFLIYTGSTSRWTVEQPVTMPLPTHRTIQTQNKNKVTQHPCLQCDSNPNPQNSSMRKQFML
jgi:hypothetical protein